VKLPGVILDKIEFPSIQGKAVEVENQYNPVKKKVLVVSNDKTSKKIYEDYLKNNNIELFYVEKAYDGINFCRGNNIDAVVVDPILSDEDGWFVLRELKDNPETEDIQFIFSSTLNEERLGYGLGLFEVLPKTIIEDNLLSSIKKLSKYSSKEVQNIFIFDTENIELMKNILSKGPYKAKYFDLMEEVNLAFENQIPDLAIFTVTLADKRVNEIMNKLKSIKLTRNIPIIIISETKLVEDNFHRMKGIIRKVTATFKVQPLEALKVLKSNFNISENGAVKEKLIIDDNEEVDNLHGDDQKSVHENNLANVLIVDDDSDTLYTVGEIVRSIGCKTVYAKNGIECLISLKNKIPDLILLDIMMPEMDGFETIKRIRKEKQFKDLPVLALTAHAMLDDKEVIEHNGFNGIVTKPINTATLAFKIQKVLECKKEQTI
jgi:CheY-like chemotaxis protein